MPIQILPARLANQIAAGEVVERPASVVKELVENSLDAGATRIDIDIDKGGSRTIRIRDNGKGIPKDELGLALSRHATSKISSLDDLEAIMSLGFRGEALASISSVARLTLTSRTAEQEEAWSAYAEGRDMAVQLKPAAHPVGTTVEVLDLFFNTPARRKFLRAEKTEFAHIDELIKRIALSRFDVNITLRHNGKVIRQYRAAQTQAQKERRLATACGQGFLQHALVVELTHGDLKLSGWICSSSGARSQNDIQYCYVNGRMMKDKLINHAIRQAYESSLAPEQYAAYVLFIDLNPHDVDVNVHPAKHEVRFHQARLVHDFIYQGIQSALQQSDDFIEIQSPQRLSAKANIDSEYSHHAVPDATYQAIEQTPDYPNKQPAKQWREQTHYETGSTKTAREISNHSQPSSDYRSEKQGAITNTPSRQYGTTNYRAEGGPSPAEVAAYQRLIQTPDAVEERALDTTFNDAHVNSPTVTESNVWQEYAPSMPEPIRRHSSVSSEVEGLGKALVIVEKQYLVVSRNQNLALLSLEVAQNLRIQGQLKLAQSEGLKPQPLLIPHSIPVSPELLESAQQHQALLQKLGIQLKAKGKQSLIIMSVCMPLRQQNLQQLIPNLLTYLGSIAEDPTQQGWDKLLDWFAQQCVVAQEQYSLSQAIQLVTELEQLWGAQLTDHYDRLLRSVDLHTAIEAFK
ncbi:TPA: DNA mismatch repair endonuclease MutL [Photobacterium damselae]